MARKASYNRSSIFSMAWRFVKRNGFSLSAALKKAWLNAKLKVRMVSGIVRFWFQKVDGSLREAYGTMKESLLPQTQGESRRPNDTVQVYFDTERQAWRSFKIANLERIADL